MGVLDSVTGEIPLLGISGSSIFSLLTYVILFIVFIIIVGVGVAFLVYYMAFNKKAVIFTRINGRLIPTKKSRAKFISHGTAGDKIFYIKSLKKYQPCPKVQTGNNTYWFWIRDDDEMINFTTGDFDLQARELGAEFTDLEMRHARTALQSQLKERYNKPKWLEKYGAVLLNVAVITIIMVFLWLIVGKLVEVIGSLKTPIDAARQVVESSNTLINSMNNICTGGSGLQPAPTT